MPQMNKGGKFIFGKSLIRTDGTLRIPPQAMEEYHIADEGKVYLFTGSKITGGFCVTRKGLLHPSKLGHILDDTPPLLDYSAGSGEFIKYKGRSYCWVEISQEGQILLTKKMMDCLKVRPGMEECSSICYSTSFARQTVKETIGVGVNEKAALSSDKNCPFVYINFDFTLVNKVASL